MKKLVSIIAGLMAVCASLRAQVDVDDEFFSLPRDITPEYLDSITIKSVKPNNYTIIGVYGGTSIEYGYFNPTRSVLFGVNPPVYGFSVIRHFSMFGLFPNMGLEFGAQQNWEGYEFKTNKETGYRFTESGAYKVVMNVPEAFLLTHFHFDATDHFKLIAKVGLYGGYRTSIQRTLDDNYASYDTYQGYVNSFRDYDKRFTYGVQGGAGFGLMLDPIEIHVCAQLKWGWESFWEPDYASPYYYRFGYPLDGAVTIGVYYQLTPRHGHSRAELRRMAREAAALELQQRRR